MSETAHRWTMHIVEQAPDTLNNTDELQRSSPKWEKPDTQAHLTHDSIQRKCSRYFVVVVFFFLKADQQLPAASAERGNGSQRVRKISAGWQQHSVSWLRWELQVYKQMANLIKLHPLKGCTILYVNYSSKLVRKNILNSIYTLIL